MMNGSIEKSDILWTKSEKRITKLLRYINETTSKREDYSAK